MSNSIRGTARPIKLDLTPPYPSKYKFPQFQLASMWRQSAVHDIFSISLPHTEKYAFEEKFKYIIVTSHMLNPSLSIHHQASDQTQFCLSEQERILPWTCGLTVLFAIEKFYSWSKLPVVTMLCSSTVVIFLSVRQKHRRSIRKLYQMSLSSVQSFIDQSEKLDSLLYQTLVSMKEEELVKQGYRIEVPHLASSSSPSTSTNSDAIFINHTRLCEKISTFLRRLFMLYEEAMIGLNKVTDHKQLNTLYDMYNIHSVTSLTSIDDDNHKSLESLRQFAQLVHAKRREFMVTLLSLKMMTDFIRSNQIKDWQIVNDSLNVLVKGAHKLNNEWEDALHSENGSFNSHSWRTHLDSLEQEVSDLSFHIRHCKENISSENDSNWVTEYWSIKQKLEHMMESFKFGEQILSTDYSQDSDSSCGVLSPKDVERIFLWSNKEKSISNEHGKRGRE